MKKKNRIWFWLSVLFILATLSALIVAIAQNKPQGSTTITGQEWFKGNPEAEVSLIEYSDFQCPACASYYPLLKRLAEEMGDEIKIIYRHFPLSSIHPQADLAAQASEAAGVQGYFWEMHDLLFEKQSEWSGQKNAKDIFIGYGRELGLDIELFSADIDSRAVKKIVSDDKISGNQAFVSGTPTLFLNGEKINNPRSYDQLRQLIQNELEK
ncbi:MAG: thioredoxin domain-containing protein [Patescibacteria group bacterium]|nr:thioredoxin domain-containing protein [Patescibacteria group bacterium]